MATAAESLVNCVDQNKKLPLITGAGPNKVSNTDVHHNHSLDATMDNHPSSSKKNRGKRRHGRKKDKASSNSNGMIDINADQKESSGEVGDNRTTAIGVHRTSNDSCSIDLHEHLNNQSQNHVAEPLRALTQMVEKLGVGDGPDIPQESLHKPEDVPLDDVSQDGGIDESLANAKCNSEDEDDADLELPSSLSDFVLGYHDECHYAVTKLPPNDDDIDTIAVEDSEDSVKLVPYESELQMPDIIRLITKDLSEPYSIYTYRYFIHNWPNLCFLAMHGSKCVGAIVCKLDIHKKMVRRGYIAMLAVDESYRKKKLGSSLVKKAIRAMVRSECDEVVLETEITNKQALHLYQNLGFVRDKRLFRYYLNGVDALRLKLWLQ